MGYQKKKSTLFVLHNSSVWVWTKQTAQLSSKDNLSIWNQTQKKPSKQEKREEKLADVGRERNKRAAQISTKERENKTPTYIEALDQHTIEKILLK